MSDTFTYRHGNSQNFATHKRGSTRIDYMLATENLLPLITSCGYLAFDSDSEHRSMFLDVDLEQFLRDTPLASTPTTKTRSILSLYKKMSKHYKESVLQKLSDTQYHQRTSALPAKIHPTTRRHTRNRINLPTYHNCHADLRKRIYEKPPNPMVSTTHEMRPRTGILGRLDQ